MRVLIALLFILLPSTLYMNHRVVDSMNFSYGQFHNMDRNMANHHWSKILNWVLTEKWGKWPSWVENKAQPTLKRPQDDHNLVITFINHATFLIEIGDKRIITDPMFSTFAGPCGLFGVKRRRDPGIMLNDLPKIEVILISHNHYDHLDLPSLHKIQKKHNAIVVVPLGDKEWLDQEGITNVHELDWWEHLTIDDQLTIHFVPSQHHSGRSLLDKNQSLWGGYVMVNPRAQIYHAGDTGYAKHFQQIGEKFNVDVALLPIGAYKPSSVLSNVHMNPHEALKAHGDLKSKVSIGMHFDTFPLSALDYAEAEQELRSILIKKHIIDNHFKILDVGESYYYHID